MPVKLPYLAPADTAAKNLAEYFERRLVHQVEVVRHEPPGYRASYDRKSEHPVLVHEGTGAIVCCHAVDLVERISRTHVGVPTRVVFLYPPRETFNKLVHLTQRDPLAAWQMLTGEHPSGVADAAYGFLQKVEEPRQASKSGARAMSKNAANAVWSKDLASWYGPVSSMDPHDLAASRDGQSPYYHPLGGVSPPAHAASAHRWGQSDGTLCVALFVPAKAVRRAAHSAEPGALEISHPHGEFQDAAIKPQLEEERGGQLIDAVLRRDAEAVNHLLQEKADPNYQNLLGWTALHAACSVRPCWEVLEALIPKTDLTLRTKKGKLPCDHCDSANQVDVSIMVRRKMLEHPHSKHMSEAQAISGAMVVNTAANQGKRRGDLEAEELLLDFGVMMMQRYKSAKAAFKAFDINANGTLSVAEFYQYAMQMRFPGDATAVFKALDVHRVGQIAPLEFGRLEKLYYQKFGDEKSVG